MKPYNGFYLVANYPDEKTFVHAAIKGFEYFDFLEIGIPFSDPVADGPVIAKAVENVLNKGFKFEKLIGNIREIQDQINVNKDIYFMTYANIVYSRGIENFAKICKELGIKGVIIPDVPFDESAMFKNVFSKYGILYVHFVTPENSKERIRQIASHAEGFLYFVSIRGITGSSLALDQDTEEKIAAAKQSSPAPVVLGFGIKDKSHIDSALNCSDGFIIGTRMIEVLEAGGVEAVGEMISGF